MNELYSLMSVNDDDLLEKTKKRRRDDFFCCYCLLMVESLSDNVTKNNWIYDSRDFVYFKLTAPARSRLFVANCCTKSRRHLYDFAGNK